MTGRHRGPKHKLRVGVACAAHYSKRFAGMWRPWWVLLQHLITLQRSFMTVECSIARFLCTMRVFKVQASSSSPGYLCAKFRFCCDLHCWANPGRKIVYSITHSINQSLTQSPSLFGAPGTKASSSEHTRFLSVEGTAPLYKPFYWMLYNNNYVLHYLVPDRCSTSTYNLRKRPHNRISPNKTGHLSERTFLIWMLFKNIY